MSKTKIKIDQSDAKARIDTQIDEGEKLAKQAEQFIRNTVPIDDRRRATEIFVTLYDQWCDFTFEVIDEIFVSRDYAYKFKDKSSSTGRMVGPGWKPDVEYYLTSRLVPQLDYLSILGSGIGNFQKEKPSQSNINTKRRRDLTVNSEDIDTKIRDTLSYIKANPGCSTNKVSEEVRVKYLNGNLLDDLSDKGLIKGTRVLSCDSAGADYLDLRLTLDGEEELESLIAGEVKQSAPKQTPHWYYNPVLIALLLFAAGVGVAAYVHFMKW